MWHIGHIWRQYLTFSHLAFMTHDFIVLGSLTWPIIYGILQLREEMFHTNHGGKTIIKLGRPFHVSQCKTLLT
jgi:hypothetical protein